MQQPAADISFHQDIILIQCSRHIVPPGNYSDSSLTVFGTDAASTYFIWSLLLPPDRHSHTNNYQTHPINFWRFPVAWKP